MIDSHVHVVSPDSAAYPRRSSTKELASHVQPLSAETLLAAMDDAGVDKAVLVQSFGAYAYDNRYAFDSATAHAYRFAFVCGIDPLDDDAGRRAQRWIERGARATRMIALSESFDMRCLVPLLEIAADTRTSVCLLGGPAVLPTLGAVLSVHPGATLVLDHCGLQSLDSARDDLGAPELMRLADVGNLVLKVSSRVFDQVAGEPARVLETLVNSFGSDRILWGSDFPASAPPGIATRADAVAAYAAALEDARRATARLTPADRDRILDGTSERVWGFP